VKDGGTVELAVANPWTGLADEAPYVLSADCRAIDRFNSALPDDDPHRLYLGVLPEPFLGYHDAPVVVLMSNPGIGPADRTIDRSWLIPANRESLTAPNGTAIYSLSERVASTPGGIFWRSFTKGLLAARRDYEVLARRILAVQLHGYHSRRPGRPRETLPSQHFQFSLVRSAMNRKAVIIVAYGGPSWYMHLPELRRYDKTVIKVSPQTRSIGLGNLTPEGRRLVMAALDK
jgi:hypothetical protein